jgi:UDP-2-acetamido-3-amino-2,3-dideoxy-glucuronate N-acetyltransferase
VTRNVPDFALVAGVPARRIGWVGRAGVPLTEAADGTWLCPQTGESYSLLDGELRATAGPA